MSSGKKTPVSLVALFGLLLSVSHAFAGASNKSGNPYGNGTFFGNDGTFSAVLRGVNLTGVTQFSTYSSGNIVSGFNSITNAATADTAANIPGTVSIYLNGVSYMGIASAVLNPSANTIAAVFSSFSLRANTNVSFSSSAVVTTTNISTNSLSFSGGISRSISGGSFTANLQNNYPNQTFQGEGQVSIPEVRSTGTNSGTNAASVLVNSSFSVDGVRVSSSSSKYY